MSFLNGDDVLNGIKRGAEKFGTSRAVKAVKKMAERINGIAPQSPEPYGLGKGGADGEQESQAPTQALNDIPKATLRQQKKLDFLKADLELVDGREEKAQIEALIKTIEDEIAGKDKILSNEDSSNLGYQSAQKTTTAETSDDHDMQSKCLACGYESQGKWNGVCESCLVKNDKDVSGNLSEDEKKENGIALDQPEPWAKEIEPNKNSDECILCKGKGSDPVRGGPCPECSDSLENAGHLQPESWMAASAEERVKWLEEASQDINLAGLPWDELSLDVHRALQREFDKSAEGALSNDTGLMRKFTFRDSNGEEETVEASDESAAWEKLSKDFGTSLSDLKAMGLKLVRHNASDTAVYDELRQINAEISKLDGLGDGIGSEDHSRLKKLLITKAGLEDQLKNANPEGDLSEIERHAEGVLHEAEELKEEGLQNAEPTVKCVKCGDVMREGMVTTGQDPVCEECELENATSSVEMKNSGVKRGLSKYGSDKSI